jgi:threonine dehydrogenase-like Zn-dependent dehydrogenase
MARAQGAITVDFDEEEPVETIQRLTDGIGVDRVIEAVGVDVERGTSGPAAEEGRQMAGQY